MNDDKTWKYILVAAALVLGVIIYGHLQRERPPFGGLRSIAPDGSEIVTPTLKPKDRSSSQTPNSLPPPMASSEQREASEKAWMQGDYRIVPSEKGILALENGFESRIFLASEYNIGACSKKRGLCLLGPELEAAIHPNLPERFLQKGSNPDSRARAPNLPAPDKSDGPPPAAPSAPATRPAKASSGPTRGLSPATGVAKPSSKTSPAATGAVVPSGR